MKKLLLRLYWHLTRAWLRFHGAEIGKNVKCNGFPHIKIRKGGRLIFGDNVIINASQWGNTLNIKGGTSFRVMHNAIMKFKSGSGVSGSRLVATESIIIGEGSIIGSNSIICDSDRHEIPLYSENPIMTYPIEIGCNVFIGMSSIITKGVKIGDGSVIGAGSVVSKSIPPHTLAAGNPAKAIRSTLEIRR